ncbi:unnamed protein product, partial [Porites evermanni]
GGKIDQIEDQQFYTFNNCLLKHFYEKKLSTTEDTIIKIVDKQETVKQPNIICCPDNLNILVNIYPIYNNKDCKKSRIARNPGSQILQCHGWNRSMPLKNCYLEVKAQFLLEKDNAQRRVTAFAKVLSTFLNEDVYEYKNKEDELTEKLLFPNNVDF